MCRAVHIWCWLVLLLAACQKVELPDATGGGATAGDSVNDIPDNVPEMGVDEVLATYDGMSREESYALCVHGYIVGFCSGTTIGTAQFSAEGARPSNLLIAGRKGETAVECCMPVELKNGTTIRAALNLQDHPEWLGRRVMLMGKVTPYFSVVGLKSVQAYQWLEDEVEMEPTMPDAPDDEPEKPDDVPDVPIIPDAPATDGGDTLTVDDVPQVIPGGRIVRSI